MNLVLKDEADEETASEKLERLAGLVLKGDVVFFIGAGFSIDSEGNTARRLMRRLVVRLLGFVSADPTLAEGHLKDLVSKFNLDPRELLSKSLDTTDARIRWLTIAGLTSSQTDNDPDPLENDFYEIQPYLLKLAESRGGNWRLLPELFHSLGEWPINRLAREYYEANEWFCSAFEDLLARSTRTTLDLVHEREEELRRSMNVVLAGFKDRGDEAPLPAFGDWFFDDQNKLRIDNRLAGKALFLETLGFGDPEIMAGNPRTADFEDVRRSYRQRLRPRHHVLARFAREGWCPTLITTNFDQLLEGAYRLAGFSRPDVPDRDSWDRHFPESLITGYDVVASAPEFFEKAKAFRTTVLVKMHGCAGRYRRLVKQFREDFESPAARAELEDCIRTMVFTYREIQHWRGDSWAADYLKTTLRTRTVVFCGYSVRDPVIHDTFRGAFEEMARINAVSTARNGLGNGQKGTDDARGAPLFFLAPAKELSFHSDAVLNAATEAVGLSRTALKSHPNRIGFQYSGFPTLDHLFRWIQHLAWRQRQIECMNSTLARAGAVLANIGLFRQKPRREITLLQDTFCKEIVANESRGESPFNTADSDLAQRRFERHIAWSERFHIGLLREFACADDIRRLEMPNLQVAGLRRHEWYFPCMENAAWTCWAVVVEMALRAAAREAKCNLVVADHARPTVFFHPIQGQAASLQAPWSLTIEFGGLERVSAPLRIKGAPARKLVWRLQASDVPWPVAIPDVRAGSHGDSSAVRVHDPRRNLRGSDFVEYRDAPKGNTLWEMATGTKRNMKEIVTP
jgi:hypothetical protein